MSVKPNILSIRKMRDSKANFKLSYDEALRVINNISENLCQEPVKRRRSRPRPWAGLQATTKRAVNLAPQKVIGRGNFSRVVVCRKSDVISLQDFGHEYREENLVVKVIDKRQSTISGQVAETELKVLRTIKHPFIVSYKFALESRAGYYLGLEFCPGGDLFTQCLKYNKFSENRVRVIAIEVLSALEVLHDSQIVYRDLKPENIAIGADGHIRLIDFGLAFEFQNDSELTTSTGGTPPYVAPEVLLRQPHRFQVDFWGLGVLIYELLAGYAPFEAESSNDLCMLICTQEVEIPGGFSREASNLIKGLLRKDIRKRFGHRETTNHAFFKGITMESIFSDGHVPFPFVKQDIDCENFDEEVSHEDPSELFYDLSKCESSRFIPPSPYQAENGNFGFDFVSLRKANSREKSVFTFSPCTSIHSN